MTDALVSALLMGQRRRSDPFDAQRNYGYGVMKNAMTPSSNWGEGLAKALQAALGGYMTYSADQRASERDKKTTDALAAALGAPDTASATAALKAGGADSEALAPIMGQLLSNRFSDERKAQLGQRTYQASGGMSGGMPQTASTTPLPQGTPSPGGFANNAGNIRATSLPWEGKGPPQNGFETFGTPQAGANAMFKNLGAYVQANPTMTVAQAIAKWAPPTENNTQAYVQRLSEATGINPAMPLGEVMKDPAVAATLMDGIARIEKGGLPQGFSADTFMQAATPQPMAGPTQVAQGDGRQMQQQQQQSFDPGADYEALGQKAAQMGDFETATKYQMEANKARTSFKTKQFEETSTRQAEGSEFDRRQVITNEGKLRDDFSGQQSVKDYRKAATVFRSAVEASKVNSAAADLNMVYAFATLMDPGSVVRDSETGMVQATQSASDRVKGLVAMVSGGQRISPDARAALLNEMGSRYEAYKVAHDELAKTFTGIAQRSGGNPDNVVIPYPGVEYSKQTPRQGPPKPGEVVDRWRFKGGDPSQQQNWEQVQ